MARMLIPFDMTVIYYNRREITPAPDFPCEYVSSQEELLRRSDVVSLNLPLNDKTKGSFGREQFNQMKDGSVLVNTARGAVVDEEAFLEALDSGKVSRPQEFIIGPMADLQLFSAGIDVFPDEPNVNPRLVNNDKITLLPHMGTETQDSQKKVSFAVCTPLRAMR
jgi:glyoxylate reductase